MQINFNLTRTQALTLIKILEVVARLHPSFFPSCLQPGTKKLLSKIKKQFEAQK